MNETGTVWGPLVQWGSHDTAPNWDPDYRAPDADKYVGGDYIEDMKAWMRLGAGERLPDL